MATLDLATCFAELAWRSEGVPFVRLSGQTSLYEITVEKRVAGAA
jgi:hypothetical protein